MAKKVKSLIHQALHVLCAQARLTIPQANR